jgi:hypothetical protein
MGLLLVNEKQWISLQNPYVAVILWARRASARLPGGPVRACHGVHYKNDETNFHNISHYSCNIHV